MEKRNYFSPKMETKSIQQLKSIFDSKNHYATDARLAAGWELEKRGKLSESEFSELPEIIKGEDSYRGFISEIKPKHSFGYSLKTSESIHTQLPYKALSNIFAEVFKKLDWPIVHHHGNQIEAKRKNSFNVLTEKLTVQISITGDINITSQSIKGSFWDMGRNSKRIKLLIHVFNEFAANYDDEKLASLLIEIEKIESLKDYVIPESLPKPELTKEPNFWLPVSLGIFSSLVLGLIFGLFTKYFYIILLYESGIGIALAFFLALGVKWGGYTNYKILKLILAGCVIVIVISSQYFQHLLMNIDYNDYDLTFIQFMELRFENGFEFDGTNTGWIGLIVMFLIQLAVPYFVGLLNLAASITNYLIKQIPKEVLDFTYYYWVKTESEEQIRKELSLKGWVLKADQDKVFEAFDAIDYQQEEMRSV